MAYADGWAALNLAMPERIPRTEFSAEDYHFELVSTVTGIAVDVHSPEEVKLRARQAFVRAWNYDILLMPLIGSEEFGELRTRMGHAVYAAEGTDYDARLACPFHDPEEVLDFDPWEAYGEKNRRELTRRFEEHYRLQCARYPDTVNTTGIYISLITGLTFIFGWELLLLAAGLSPRRFGALTDRYASWIQQYYDALAEADVPVIYSHDDMVWAEGAIFHPDWYRRYVFPNFERFWAPLRARGKKVIFVCDGNYTRFVDDIAACGVDGFWCEVFTDLGVIARRYGKTHVLIGNADTRVLLSGSRAAIRAEVQRCLDIGRDCPGYFFGVTNHIPPNTPVQSALYYNQVYEELGRR